MNGKPSGPLSPQTKRRLLHTSREQQRASEQLLHLIVSIRRKTQVRAPQEFLNILNSQEFILLLNFDLAVLIEDVVSAENDFRANLYTRLLLLTVYESARSLRSMLDHRFRSAFITLMDAPGLEDDLKKAHSRIAKLFRRCESEFGDVRNGILGHRDQDAETRIHLIERTATEHVTELTIELLAALSPVVGMFFLFWDALAPDQQEDL